MVSFFAGVCPTDMLHCHAHTAAVNSSSRVSTRQWAETNSYNPEKIFTKVGWWPLKACVAGMFTHTAADGSIGNGSFLCMWH